MMAPRSDDGQRGNVAPTDLERHSGLVIGLTAPFGRCPSSVTLDHGGSISAALQEVIAADLRAGPCMVRFSGGRDSSLVLALAARIARCEGLEPPVALTVRYPGDTNSSESEWQDLVVSHLGVPHEVIEVPVGEDELAGPFAVMQLVRHGLTMPPPALIWTARIAPAVAGRTVLTGEGGDEILGESRISLYTSYWRRPRRPQRAAARMFAYDVMPRPVRRLLAARSQRRNPVVTWLRPQARQEVHRALVEHVTDEPWDWRAARWQLPRTRMWQLGSARIAALARSHGYNIHHPLTEPYFVSALCRAGGRAGLTSRTQAMRLLADGTLPEQVLRRYSKASFNNVYAGDRVRSFARQWDGSGVDPGLVNIDRLRDALLAPLIPAPAYAPLQLALLAAIAQGWEAPATLGRTF